MPVGHCDGRRGGGNSTDEAKEVGESQTVKHHICPTKDFGFMLLTK